MPLRRLPERLAAVTSQSAARVAGEALVEERLTGTETMRDRG
jgi:hypothetical protein